MKRHSRIGKLVVMALAALGMSGITATAKEEMRLYIWTEYHDPAIITAFEEKYDCTVVLDYYESNEEALAKLQAGGMSQYDLVVPSDFIMRSFIELGVLQPLDKTLIPNMANLKPTFVNPPYDPGNTYSAAWQWGTVGLVYNKEKVKDFEPSWSMIFVDKDNYPYMLFDSEREQIGIALTYLGYSMNTTDMTELKAAMDLLIAAKQNKACQGFEANVGGRNKVIAGTVDLAICYNGDALQSMGEHPELGFVNPKEGAVVWVDSLCIPAKAPNARLANLFINYILEPEVGAQLSNFNQFATPNAASMPFINKEDLDNPAIYPDAETEKRLSYIQDMGKQNQIYSELWKTVKTR